MQNTLKFNPVSNRETFDQAFEAIDDDDTPIDLTGATITMEVRDPRTQVSTLTASTDSEITIITTTFTVRFEVERMRALDPKEYDVGCTILFNGDTTQFFLGKLPVLDGIVS